MLRFRALPAPNRSTSPGPIPLEQVRRLIADAVSARHFFVEPSTILEWQHQTREEVSWEIFYGRLLDPAHSRERRAFEAWNVFLVEASSRSAEPLLSVKLEANAGQIHVVRALHCHAWEGYHAGEGVYLTRETRKWVRELVGTISLARFVHEDDLRDEVICLVFHAVVGTSRLPLTSVEAPLPAFSLGQLAYFNQYASSISLERGGGAIREATTGQELLDHLLHGGLSRVEQAKLLETLLHVVPQRELGHAADHFVERWGLLGHSPGEIPDLVRTLFNEVSLSPYTNLVDKTLTWLTLLREREYLSAAKVVDLLGHLLRQTGRHLTAYDLVTFHHSGANYPDALLLDALIKAYLMAVDRDLVLFLDQPGDGEVERKQKRLRRRALRQGWILRRRYEGHLVPDTPTSQGENLRVLPPPHAHVPEEQLLHPHRRNRRLFAGDPLDAHLNSVGRAVLMQSIADLSHPLELRELGVALFLDRPLGALKSPVEPDQTLLLSYEAYSRNLVERRLDALAHDLQLLSADQHGVIFGHLHSGLKVAGIPVETIACACRPGVVSLSDARRVADDFLLLHSTRRSVADFLDQYDFRPLSEHMPLDWLTAERRALIVGEVGSGQQEILLRVYDDAGQARMELAADLSAGYGTRAGVEFPLKGLRVRRIWRDPGTAEEPAVVLVLPPALSSG